MILQEILFKEYRALLDAPVTRRHYMDSVPTGGKLSVRFTQDSPRVARMKTAVISHLKKHPGSTSREITKSLAISMKQLQAYTRRLIEEGVVRYELGNKPKGGGRRQFMYYVSDRV